MAIKKYSIFDGAYRSQYLDLALGGRAIEASLSLQPYENQYCRGTIGIPPVGVAAFEILHYGESLSPETNASFGIVFGDTTFAPGRGSDNSLGFELYVGTVAHNDSVVATFSGESNFAYGVVVDFDRRTIALYRGSTLLVGINFPTALAAYASSGELCYILVSLGDGPAGKSRLWVNAGQQQFETPALENLGWFVTEEAPFNIRVAEQDYLSPPTAAEPNTRYRGVIMSAGALSTRTLSFWVWGGNTTGASALRMTLANGDGFYDATIGGDFRNEPAELSALLSNGTVQFLNSYIFDKAEATSDNEIQLTFRDSMAELEKPGQNRFFLPNAEGSVANRAYPTTIGAAFSVPLVPYDLLNRLYAVDSLGTARVGKVRDSGDPLELAASPPDYEVVDGGRAVRLRFDPEGIVTADIGVTSTDLTALNGSPPLDILLGNGNPFDAADWTAGSFGGGPGAASILAGGATFELDGSSGYQWLEYTGPGGDLIAGRGYVIRFTVERLPNATNRATTFTISSNASGFSAIVTVRGQPEPEYGFVTRTWERTYEVYYSPSFNHGIFLIYFPTAVTGAEKVRITGLTITEIPVIDPSQEDSEVDEEITPVPLQGALKQLIEDRWQLPPTFWNEADATAIDLETGYAGIGWHAQEQYVRRQAVEDILTGYTAATYVDEMNRLRIVRLIAPESVADSGVAGEIHFESDMLGELTPAYDDAPGLTTRLGVRKNYRVLEESDIVSDFLEVPLSLRRRLALDYRIVVSSGVQLAAGLSHAEQANAVGTALARAEDGQREIDRICSIYARSRSFYTTKTPYVYGELQLGLVYRVFYPRYGMGSGVKLMLVGDVVNQITRERESLVFWGLAPSELLKEST